VYRSGLEIDGRSFDVTYRPIAGGVEDFVYFHARPGREQLSYDVDLTRVAGLRLVEDVVELLDSSGAPRLRMRPDTPVPACRHRSREVRE